VGEPERQCIGCGRRGPQSGFLRLAVVGGTEGSRVAVVHGAPRGGRGAYLCRRHACLERAVARKAFQKAFRIGLVIDRDELVAALEDGNGR
jgi:predicted RNA-binding protein YlxR (DUF448 family)